jgi:predicted dehydrogenase/threonine dehydrogenase-like Zn-dependent dehydrogenase
MKQVLQDVSSGEIAVVELPEPVPGPASVLAATRFSLISAGTERALTELGRKSLVDKARARPDLVRKVIDSVRADGPKAAYEKVRGRLAEPSALGYSSSATVLEAPEGSPAAPGELVACGGAGHACHAELVAVPRTLCARVPEGVAAEDAAYSAVAAIALHGVRLCGLQLGEVVAVVGLGLVGQLTAEILAAAGAVPLGVDPIPQRAELARASGFWATTDGDELVAEAARRTERRGADAAVVAAATSSSAALATAVAAARERATVCIVGDVPIDPPRRPLFEKELRLVVSRSYGPGRYDPVYEELGQDYPAGYVRWTEGRNLAEVLRLMAAGDLRPSRLTTHTFDISEGPRAYELLDSGEPSMGILLRYPERSPARTRAVEIRSRRSSGRAHAGATRLAVVGAGTFARTVLLPALEHAAEIRTIVTATGASARAAATRFGAGTASTDPSDAVDDPDVDAVVIATRHDTHAGLAERALRAGKHVFVEKPLAIEHDELDAVAAALEEAPGTLTVGFNRRFAPLAVELRDALSGSGPLMVHYRVNAGRLPHNHWTRDPLIGGGRIAGEVCHFVDFLAFLCGEHPSDVAASAVTGSSEPPDDCVVATLGFPGGSIGTIHYSALGDPALPKERVEVLGEAGAGVLDDFRRLELYRGGKRDVTSSRRDKGHAAEISAFLNACRTGVPAQDPAELVAVSRATLELRDAVGDRRRSAV